MICKIEGCLFSYHANGYCNRHNLQMVNHGKLLQRTKYDPNEYVMGKNICRIFLYNSVGVKIAETIIDKKNFYKCKPHKWGMAEDYVRYRKNGRNVLLHTFLLNPSKGFQVDHKNGDKLNNLESNLRIATVSQNRANSKIPITNTSGYKGVYESGPNWRARIEVNYTKINLGSFKDIKLAALAYNEAAKEFFGDFAYINEVPM